MTRITLGRDDLLGAVAAAVRAPSVHNTQPWHFRLLEDGVEVHADRDRQLMVADRDGRALRVSCGAAVFNLRLALSRLGYRPAAHLTGAPFGMLAVVRAVERRPPSPLESGLHTAIARRSSNRAPFLDTAVPADARASLIEAARLEGGWMDLVLGPAGLDMVAQLVRVADRMLTADPDYRAEVAAWTRADPDAADGVPRRAGGPAPEPFDLLARRDFGGPPRPPGHDFEQEPLVGVLGGASDTPVDDVVAGQALQRVLLTATREGLATSLMSQPIDVAQVREELRLGLRRYGTPQMLLRFGYGVPGAGAGRRPVADVLLPEHVPIA
jgi:nitroreductase